MAVLQDGKINSRFGRPPAHRVGSIPLDRGCDYFRPMAAMWPQPLDTVAGTAQIWVNGRASALTAVFARRPWWDLFNEPAVSGATAGPGRRVGRAF